MFGLSSNWRKSSSEVAGDVRGVEADPVGRLAQEPERQLAPACPRAVAGADEALVIAAGGRLAVGPVRARASACCPAPTAPVAQRRAAGARPTTRHERGSARSRAGQAGGSWVGSVRVIGRSASSWPVASVPGAVGATARGVGAGPRRAGGRAGRGPRRWGGSRRGPIARVGRVEPVVGVGEVDDRREPRAAAPARPAVAARPGRPALPTRGTRTQTHGTPRARQSAAAAR